MAAPRISLNDRLRRYPAVQNEMADVVDQNLVDAKAYADLRVAAIVARENWMPADQMDPPLPFEWDAGTDYPPRVVVRAGGAYYWSAFPTSGDDPTASDPVTGPWRPIATTVDAGLREHLAPEGGASNRILAYADGRFRAREDRVFDLRAVAGAKGDGSVDETPNITAAMTTARARGIGAVYVPAGLWTLHRPILGQSNVDVICDPEAILRNTYVPALNAQGNPIHPQTGVCVFPGNYHPAWLHVNGGPMPWHPVAASGRLVTFPDGTHGYVPGQLVGLYTAEDDYLDLHKIVDVDGAEVLLERAVTVDFAGLDVFATDGTGAALTIRPDGVNNETVPSGFIENFRIIGGKWETVRTSWIARAGCLRGGVEDVEVLRSTSLLFGNAFTECEFHNIFGVYTNRLAEITDGGRLNRGTSIRGRFVYDEDTSTADNPCIKVGRDDVFEGFEFDEEVANRTAPMIRYPNPRATIRDVKMRLTGAAPPTPIIQLSSNLAHPTAVDGCTLEDVEIFADLPTGRVLDLANVKKVRVDGVTATMPAGDNDLRLFGAVDGTIENVTIPGRLDLAQGATLDTVRMHGCTYRELNQTGALEQRRRIIGSGNRFTAQAELAGLARDAHLTPASGTEVTATAETAFFSRVFSAAQALNLGDRIEVEGTISKGGATGSVRVKWLLGNKTLIDYTGGPAGYRSFRLAVEVVNAAGTAVHYWGQIVEATGAVVPIAGFETGVALGVGSAVELRVWKIDGAGTTTLRRWRQDVVTFLNHRH